MKSGRVSRYKYASVPLLFLLAISPTVLLSIGGSSAAEAATAAACTNAIVDREMLDLGNPVSNQTVQSFAENSAEYKTAVTGYSSVYLGYTNEYDIDTANCTVSWHDAAANFQIRDSNGATSNLAIGVNPLEGTVYGITKASVLAASIATTNSETYSGYAVADASPPTSTNVDYASAYWTMPAVYLPSGSGQPSCDYTSHDSANQCILYVWDGLQNSTYDGADHVPSHTGEVIQTGIGGNETCYTNNNPCVKSYIAWNEYLRANSTHIYPPNSELCSWHPSPGDSISGVVGSELEINGTSGNNYYTVLNDWTLGKSCGRGFATNTYVHTEYYADFFAERPQVSSSSFYALPQFDSTTYTDVEMGSSGSGFGAYPNYNNGYGFGSYMYNLAINTGTSSMTEISGGTTGEFTVSWDSSADT